MELRGGGKHREGYGISHSLLISSDSRRSKRYRLFIRSTWDLDRNSKSIDLLARHAINSWLPDQDFKLISSTAQTNLAGRPAYAIVFKHLNNGFDSKTTQLGTIFDDKVYYIVFSTEAVKYDAFLPTVQKMISSFELTPMKREK